MKFPFREEEKKEKEKENKKGADHRPVSEPSTLQRAALAHLRSRTKYAVEYLPRPYKTQNKPACGCQRPTWNRLRRWLQTGRSVGWSMLVFCSQPPPAPQDDVTKCTNPACASSFHAGAPHTSTSRYLGSICLELSAGNFTESTGTRDIQDRRRMRL